MNRRILHVDMDAFFAAVEIRENPALRDLPVIVGGRDLMHGVVTTASYKARVYGVRSAMSLEEARRRCPQGIYLPARHHLYRTISHDIMCLLMEYTPQVEKISIDEAFLDITNSQKLFGDAISMAGMIQGRVLKEFGLSCSIGISYNKFLAKLASDMKKPYGLTAIGYEDLAEKVWPLSIERMMGIGHRSAAQLKRLGIYTIGDLAQQSPQRLSHIFGKNTLKVIHRAQGHDPREVVSERLAKSFGKEMTFYQPQTKSSQMLRQLMNLTEEAVWRMRQANLVGAVVVLKWKTVALKTHTRQMTLSNLSNSFQDIWSAVVELYQVLPDDLPLRLVGMYITRLHSAQLRQQTLFDHGPNTHTVLDDTLDAINQRFGYGTMKRAFQIERDDIDDRS